MTDHTGALLDVREALELGANHARITAWPNTVESIEQALKRLDALIADIADRSDAIGEGCSFIDNGVSGAAMSAYETIDIIHQAITERNDGR